LIADERATFLHHLGEAETHWQSARNITLSSHVQRLAVQGQRARTSGDSEEIAHEAVTQIDKASGGETRSLLSACRNPAERATRALGLLVASVGGRTGWLYVLGEQGLRLAAPESGDEPPDAIARALAAFVERGSEARDETLSFADVAKGPGRWMPVLLRFGGWDGAIVGAVAIETDGDTSREPEGSLVDRLARELHASGDALARHDFGTTGPTSGEVNA